MVITTILGSCIAVCLQDPVARVGGMNHFLLSEPRADAVLSRTDMQRYGIHAMELLINELMKLGAARSRLRAQVYGGANVLSGLGSIGSSNAAFPMQFLKIEGITVGHSDVGGKLARKVEFLPFEGKARCSKLSGAVPPEANPDKPVLPGMTTAGEVELF